jgi:hypothetical protein
MAKKASAETDGKKSNVNLDDITTCYIEYTDLRAQGARIQLRIATMFGRFEKMGVDKKAIKAAYAEAQKDPAVAAAQRAKDAEYMRILEIIEIDASGQGGFGNALDKSLAQVKPSMDAQTRLAVSKAFWEGHDTGLEGGNLDANRYEPGTQFHVKWTEGFHAGHAERLEQNPDADKITTAQPRRGPGRPRGSGKKAAATPTADGASGDGIGATQGNA